MPTKPIIIVDHYKNAALQSPESNNYCGLRIHALPGLHELLGNICSNYLKRGAHILDLAAGSGAMSMRLKDLGFQPVAADYVLENFRAKDIPFHQLDLNENFSEKIRNNRHFDAIMASEIIEHLENPFHFFRQCSELLKPEGVLILSTPNTQNTASVINFLRDGYFLWFSDTDRQIQGHINPLTQWQIRYAIRTAKLEVRHEESYGENHSKAKGSKRLSFLAALLDKTSRIPISLRGEIYICVATKQQSSKNTTE